MAGKEILIGFLVAGGIAAHVPREAFETVFPRVGPEWLQAILHALIAPAAATLTFIGSMGTVRSPRCFGTTASPSRGSWPSSPPTSSYRPA